MNESEFVPLLVAVAGVLGALTALVHELRLLRKDMLASIDRYMLAAEALVGELQRERGDQVDRLRRAAQFGDRGSHAGR